MVPKYAFRVDISYKHGANLRRESHNYELLSGALQCRERALGKPGTCRVTILQVVDETSRERNLRPDEIC